MFDEFSVLLHKSMERYSVRDENSGFSFYIPSKSLRLLHIKENRLGSKTKRRLSKGDEICLIAGFPYNGLNKFMRNLGSALKKDKSKDNDMKRTSIRIINFGQHDFGKIGLPERFDRIVEDEILGVIIDITKVDSFYDKNLSILLNEYFKQRSNSKNYMFIVLNLPIDKGKKLIFKIFTKEDSQEEVKRKAGMILMKNNLPKTWNLINKKNTAGANYFFSTYTIVSNKHHRIHPKPDGFEPFDLHPNVLIYPYFQYIDMISYIGNKIKTSKTQKEILSEIRK